MEKQPLFFGLNKWIQALYVVVCFSLLWWAVEQILGDFVHWGIVNTSVYDNPVLSSFFITVGIWVGLFIICVISVLLGIWFKRIKKT